METEKWFVIKTNPRAEKQVAKRLTELGIENYLPLQKQLKQWHDRKKYVDEVLFKSYVFVKTTENLRQEVFGILGVVKYLFIANKIAVVTEKEIEQIKIFCKFDEVKIEEQIFIVGEKVEIICGELIGLKGTLQQTVGGHKLSIKIESLNCFATVNIDKDKVRKLLH